MSGRLLRFGPPVGLAESMAAHPSSRSKLLAQVERQQVLGALVKCVGEGWLDLDDTDVLPLIVDVLLRNAPQAVSAPEVVARSLEEAAEAHRHAMSDTAIAERYAGEAAFIVSRLAAGSANEATHAYLMGGCRVLADHLAMASR